MIYKSLAIVIIAAGLTSLFSSVYAIPSTSELTDMSGMARQNSGMVIKLSGAINTCTDEIKSFTFTHWTECQNIVSSFNKMMHDFITQNSAAIDTLNPYDYSYSPYGIN